MPRTWQEVSREILDVVDLASEYSAMGVESSGEPSASGWLSCLVHGSDERNPSAGINTTGEHPTRGRYKEFAGQGRNLSFWEFCSTVANRWPTWQDAREHYRKTHKVKKPPKTAKDPSDQLAFRDWNDSLVLSWCRTKPPIAHWAVREAGGRLAGWPAVTSQNTVIALPVFNQHGPDDFPIGWVIWNKSGKKLPLYQGKGVPPRPVKMLSVSGSTAGWMNAHGLRTIEAVAVVWKVEGPGDMLALQSVIPAELLRTVAVVANSGGSKEIPRAEYLEIFRGKSVRVLHDADQPGQDGGQQWAEAIAAVASDVWHVQLPYKVIESGGKDLRDWLNEGGCYTLLGDLPADEVKPPTTPAAGADENDKPDALDRDRQICEEVGIDVLGETGEQRSIRIFCPANHKDTTITSISRFSYEDLLQAAGQPARDKVHEAAESSPGMHSFKQIKRSIALLGGQTRIPDHAWRGLGCWPGDSGEVVLVGAGHSAVWDGSKLHKVDRPRAAGLFLDLSASEQWYDFDRLERYLTDMNPEWAKEQLSRVITIFDRWSWRETGSFHVPLCPYLVSGLVLATWIQTSWTWRPMVAIRGESSSGKSMLFEAINGLFGRLGLMSSKPTEAGLRQAVGSKAVAILVDEFESDKHRKAILELFRTSSRGSQQLRGTANQEGRSTGLQHIGWVAAVEVGLERAPDKNRYLFFELVCPPAEQMGKLDVPGQCELRTLGQKLLAIAVYHQRAALEMHATLKRYTIPGVQTRVIESVAVPVSMLATAGELEPTGLLADILGAVGTDIEADVTDQASLMESILSSSIRLGKNEEATVSQALTHASRYTDAPQHLERYGIAIVDQGRGARQGGTDKDIFLDHATIRRTILRDTKWGDQAVDQILIRLDGARKRRCTVAGKRAWGISVPWELFAKEFLEEGWEGPPADF